MCVYKAGEEAEVMAIVRTMNCRHITQLVQISAQAIFHFLKSPKAKFWNFLRAECRELYQDLSIQSLEEDNLVEKFVVPDFECLSDTEKEKVVESIKNKWDILEAKRNAGEINRKS